MFKDDSYSKVNPVFNDERLNFEKNNPFNSGGNNQVSLAQEVINQNHNLILVDPNLNSPCSRSSNILLQHDTRFYIDIIKDIKEKKLKIDGVISDQSDAALKSTSIIAEELGLASKSLSFINNSLNKATQYEILSRIKSKSQKHINVTRKRKDFLERFENELFL